MLRITKKISAPCGAAVIALVTAVEPVAGQVIEIGPQVRIDVDGAGAANEASMTANPKNALIAVAGFNDWRNTIFDEAIRTYFSITLDGGQTWDDFIVRPPQKYWAEREGDPMTAVDPETGTMWVAGISFDPFNGTIYIARKDPGSDTFGKSVTARLSAFPDKGWMVAGPRPGLPGSTRLYIAYNEGVIWSDDMGDTFTDPIPLALGLGFHPRVDSNGVLYVAYWDLDDGMMLKRSLDGGETYTTHTIATRMDVWAPQDGARFPGTFRAPSFVYIAVDPVDGSLYAVYFDTSDYDAVGNANVDLYLTRSSDQGDTWSVPVIVGNQTATAGDQILPWIEVDQKQRVHMVYLDTGLTQQHDGVEAGMVDFFYALSTDQTANWSFHRLTPASWNSNDDGLDREQQFIGDYIGLGVAGDRAYPVYLDASTGDPDIVSHAIRILSIGDIDRDGLVGLSDIVKVLYAWGPCTGDECAADVNEDGVVGLGDLLLVYTSMTPG